MKIQAVIRYWLPRLATALALMLAVSLVAFGAMNLLGDPLFHLLGPVANDTGNPESAKLIAAAKAQYHLDDPFLLRYGRWLSDFVRGDFGVQFGSDGQPPVRSLIAERAPRSVALLILGQVFAVTLAIPWAVMAAAKEDRALDRFSTINTFLLISIPNFALAVLLKWVLAIKLDIFPLRFIATDPAPLRLWQLVLPAFSLALPIAAVYQRLLRTDLITTLQEDFILMARAKGVSRRAVLFRHALRPSMFSFITVFGINTGALIGGALIIEVIFGIPGLGSAIVEAVLREDFPVVLAIVMLVSCAFVVVNLIVDMLYSVLDPRVRTE